MTENGLFVIKLRFLLVTAEHNNLFICLKNIPAYA